MAIVTAVIIARGGSSRLPGKNMKDFHGNPLVAHKVKQLLACRSVTNVVVGSDCDEILSAARDAGATTVKRAPEFCDEKTRSWNEVIADMCGKVDGDVILWAHCTNPLIHADTYDRAVSAFMSGDKDSLVSVTRLQSHLWLHGEPFNFDPKSKVHPVARDLEPVFYQNGGIFIARREDMISWRYVYNDPLLFEIGAIESSDIDTPEDFMIAEALYGH